MFRQDVDSLVERLLVAHFLAFEHAIIGFMVGPVKEDSGDFDEVKVDLVAVSVRVVDLLDP